MKKFLLSALALVAVAALAITGTIAYLQWEDEDVNVMTLGNVKIAQHEYQRADGIAYNAGEPGEGNGIKKGDLEEFEQNQALYPAVPKNGLATDYSAEATDLFFWGDYVYSGTAGNGLWNDNKLSNVMDKMVFVENTGSSDCYFRTYIAFECPVGMEYSEGTDKEFMMNINGSSLYKWENLGYHEADGVRYLVMEATYLNVLKPGQTAHPSLLQVVMTHNATNEDMELLGDTYEIIVLSQAVQAAGFEDAEQAVSTLAAESETETIPAAVVALNTSFGVAKGKYSDAAYDTNVEAWINGAREKVASEQVDAWDGTADISWYNENDTEFIITTAEQLAGLAELVDGGNTFAGKTVKLGRDLDLKVIGDDGEPVSFNPIGYGYDIVFKGTFDGQAHTVANLYQNGWALGYDYSTEGGGLFASVVDATIKNVTIENANIVMECVDMGVLVGYSYGNCTYENILVKDSSIANYQRYTGGVVGEVNGTQTFTNVDVVDTVVSTLWGDFDTSLGGIVGGKWGEAQLTFTDCDVACAINAYNDVVSANMWHAYRRAGMLIGNSEETTKDGDRTTATASYLTCNNCTVTYGDWVNYTYCEFTTQPVKPSINPNNYPYVRVQGSDVGQSAMYSNPRYGVAVDAAGNNVVDDNHVHNDDEDHNVLRKFDQLFGGGQGVYGTATHDGVTVNYSK